MNKKATVKQVNLFRSLFVNSGTPLPTARLRKFKNLSATEAFDVIAQTKLDLEAKMLIGFVPNKGHTTPKQLAFLLKNRSALGQPVSVEEVAHLRTLTTTEMQRISNEVFWAVQTRNDAKGAPPPAWRIERGLYDSTKLRAGHREAVARQEAKRATTRATSAATAGSPTRKLTLQEMRDWNKI